MNTSLVFWPAVLLLLVNLATPAQTKLVRNPDDGGGQDAYHVGRRAAEKSLKAPSTAKFSHFITDQSTGWLKHGWNQWRVGGYVDAQNSFGAMIRDRWEAVVRKADTGFEVVYLKVGDKASGKLPAVALAPTSIQASNLAFIKESRLLATNTPASTNQTTVIKQP